MDITCVVLSFLDFRSISSKSISKNYSTEDPFLLLRISFILRIQVSPRDINFNALKYSHVTLQISLFMAQMQACQEIATLNYTLRSASCEMRDASRGGHFSLSTVVTTSPTAVSKDKRA